MQDLKHLYSNNIENEKIVIFGPVPLPYGGISVHIERVVEKLKKQKNKVFIFNSTQTWFSSFAYLKKLAFFLFKKRPHKVFFHTLYTSDYRELLMMIILRYLLRFELIVIEHDCRYLEERDGFLKIMISFFLNVTDKIVFIGDTTYESYLQAKIKPKNFSVESAFLPPCISTVKDKWKLYPSDLHDFVKIHAPVMALSVFKFSVIKDRDLYGFDRTLDVLFQLKKKYHKIGLICVVSSDNKSKRYLEILDDIKKKELISNVFFLHNKYELWPLFFHIDLFLRPTISDSYGVSVAEALYCGIPSLASDVCVRHKGADLFSIDKGNDHFLAKIERILDRI